jgi:isoleucyl-tRNA synthetase
MVQALRVLAPITPFQAEHLWQSLVVSAVPHAPESVFLAGWPAAHEADGGLLSDIAAVRQVVELGRRARAASRQKLRQPLRALVVEGADVVERYADQIADELRIKHVSLGRIETSRLRVRPNLPVVAKRLGRDVPVVKAALEAGEFVEHPDGSFEVAGHRLSPAEVLVERLEKEGWAVAAEEGVTVALDTTLDDELLREGRVYETIHLVNNMRKEAGLAITDRIELRLPATDRDLLAYQDWIAAETLATTIDVSTGGDVQLARVGGAPG